MKIRGVYIKRALTLLLLSILGSYPLEAMDVEDRPIDTSQLTNVHHHPEEALSINSRRENSRIFSLSPQINRLNQEQEELCQLIINGWELEENVPLTVQKRLEKVQLPHEADQLLKPLLARFLLPYDLLFDASSVSHTHPILSVQETLQPEHAAFETINRLIRETELLLSAHIQDDSCAWIRESLRRGISYYQQFMQNFCAGDGVARSFMLSPQARICGPSLGYYLIAQDKARELLFIDLYGQPTGRRTRGNPDEGMSDVLPKGGVHYKKGEGLAEIDPAMEWAMYASSTLLGGADITPSGFLYIDNVLIKALPKPRKMHTDEAKEQVRQARELFAAKVEGGSPSLTVDEFFSTYPQYKPLFSKTKRTVGSVQASKTVGEISFHEFFEYIQKGEASFDDLDPGSVSRFMILSLLNVFADAKDDNLRLVKIGGKWHLVGIDSDHALAHMIVQKQETFGSAYHVLQGKNVLFLCKQLMHATLDPTVYRWLLDFNPYAFVMDWLKGLEDQNERYASLPLDRPTEGKYFPLKLCPEAALEILNRLLKVQSFAEANQEVTPHQLLSELDPLAAIHYQKLRDMDPEDPGFLQHVHLYGLKRESREVQLFESNPTVQGWVARVQADATFTPTQVELESITASPFGQKIILHMLSRIQGRNLAEVLDELGPVTLEQTLATEDLQEEQAKDDDYVTQRTSNLSEELAHILEKTEFSLLNKAQRLEVINRLVSYWPDVQLPFDPFCVDPEDNNRTVLQQVIASNKLSPDVRTKAVSSLLRNRGEERDMVNHQALGGLTALDLAAQENLEEVMALLLENGAGAVFHDQPLERFYHHIRGNADWKTSHLRTVLKEKKKSYRHLNWVLQRTKFLVPEGIRTGEEVTILAYNNGHYDPEKRYLPANYRDHLWDNDGQFKAIHTNDSRMVGRALGNEKMGEVKQRLYFKRFPSFPGTAMAISMLQELLFGEGWLPLTFAKINDEPFLISLGIGRLHRDATEANSWHEVDNLQYIFDNTPERLRELDAEDLVKVILLAMTTNPEDGKPSNYCFERISNTRSRLIEIDGDQAFVPGVSRQSVRNQDFLIQLKSVLFCMDHMALSWNQVPPALLEHIRRWDAFELSKEWVKRLDILHYRMRELFRGSVPRLLNEKSSYIGVPFYKGEAGSVYKKLFALQQHFTTSPEERLIDTYARLEPYTARRYIRIFNEAALLPVSLKERFEVVDNGCYTHNANVWRRTRERSIARQRGEPYLTSTTAQDLLMSQNIPLDILPLENRVTRLNDGDSFDPQMALEELARFKLEHANTLLSEIVEKDGKLATLIRKVLSGEQVDEIELSLKNYPLHQQRLILEQLKVQKPVSLVIKSSSLITRSFLNRFLGPQVTLLELTDCQGVDNSIVFLIATQIPKLESLNLSRSPSLTSIRRPSLIFSSQEVIEFPRLKYLFAEECPSLTDLFIRGVYLKEVVVSRCPSLANIIVQCPCLIRWDSQGSLSITPSIFISSGASSYCLREIWMQKPVDPTELYLLGMIYKKTSRENAKMIAAFDEAGDRGSCEAAIKMGNLSRKKALELLNEGGDYEKYKKEAKVSYKRALSTTGTEAKAYYGLARLYLAKIEKLTTQVRSSSENAPETRREIKRLYNKVVSHLKAGILARRQSTNEEASYRLWKFYGALEDLYHTVIKYKEKLGKKLEREFSMSLSDSFPSSQYLIESGWTRGHWKLIMGYLGFDHDVLRPNWHNDISFKTPHFLYRFFSINDSSITLSLEKSVVLYYKLRQCHTADSYFILGCVALSQGLAYYGVAFEGCPFEVGFLSALPIKSYKRGQYYNNFPIESHPHDNQVWHYYKAGLKVASQNDISHIVRSSFSDAKYWFEKAKTHRFRDSILLSNMMNFAEINCLPYNSIDFAVDFFTCERTDPPFIIDQREGFTWTEVE